VIAASIIRVMTHHTDDEGRTTTQTTAILNSVLTSKKTTRLHHKDQLVDAVYGNNRCLF
jgi:hypothetical protein